MREPNAETVAKRLRLPKEAVRFVKRQLPASAMRKKAVPRAVYDTETVGQVLRRVLKDAAPDNGVLTEALYEKHRRSRDPSLARLNQVYGKWNETLTAHRLATGPSTGERRQYTRDDCVSALAACASDLDKTPTYAQYEGWARMHAEAPSGQTVRNRLGRWLEALAAAGL
jgi:hypothetical protein